MSLYLDLQVGDQIKIGESTVTLEEKSGRRARVCVDADKSLSIQLNKNTTGGDKSRASNKVPAQ